MLRKIVSFLFPIFCTGIFLLAYILYNQKQDVVEDLSQRPGSQEFERIDFDFMEGDLLLEGNNKRSIEISHLLNDELNTIVTNDPFWEELDATSIKVYVHKEGDYLMILNYLPGIMRYNEGEQKKLSHKLWPIIQKIAKEDFSNYPTIGLGFRDSKKYGLISIGGINTPGREGKDQLPVFQQFGGEHIFYPYFIKPMPISIGKTSQKPKVISHH